jgi:hypothetical protein
MRCSAPEWVTQHAETCRPSAAAVLDTQRQSPYRCGTPVTGLRHAPLSGRSRVCGYCERWSPIAPRWAGAWQPSQAGSSLHHLTACNPD